MNRTVWIVVFTLAMLTAVNAAGRNDRFRKIADGIVVRADSLDIRVHVLGEKIIHVECTTADETQKHKELSVIHPSPGKSRWTLVKNPGEVVVSTKAIQAAVDIASGKIVFRDVSGGVLLAENGREVVPETIIGEKTHSVVQKFTLSPGEALYGLGQHQEGNYNLRGKTVELYQANMNVSVPVLLSTKGYGIFWDNPSLSKFTDNSDGMKFWSEVADGISYYFIAGRNLDEVVSGYRNLTGQAPMYPKWAYGFFQSKERYKTQEEIVGIVDEFRQRQIPLDVIVQDWYYWDPEKWGSHYMNRDRYPDPPKMTADIHKNNAKIIVSVWGKFFSPSPNYSEMEKSGYLWNDTWEKSRYYDPYTAGARSLYWKQIRDSLFRKGFDGWWLDATEPEIGELRNDEIKKLMNNPLGTGARYLNTFPLMTTKAVYDGQRATTPDKRVYILTRSAFAGQQRNAATTWSGDITASWEVFRKQIPAGLNFCATGIPYWTTDIGGFFVRVPGGCRNDMYRELFTRWYQYGAFCPIFRVHGTNTPREMWRFGDTASWAIDAQLKFDNLRYRLMPYIYTLGWKVTHENFTMMRGLAFDFTADSAVYTVDNQFMFGPSILVNPVTTPMYYPWVEADSGSIIPSENLVDMEGKPGLSGEYYEGMNFNMLVATRSDRTIDFDWGTGAPMKGMTPDTFSIRWRGRLIAPETGEYTLNTISDDGTRLYIDNRLIVDIWQDQAPQVASGTIVLEAGKSYDVKLEYYENQIGAVAQLRWILPSRRKKEAVQLPEKTRKVYLPGTTRWIDFWTGETFSGGQTVMAPAPIDIMPLYVRAGSILPMGPFLQYATEKPADPIELRIYPGADGKFELYEDENDNYNYEKGKYALIPFSWNDKENTLTIGERRGKFNGMLEDRTINIVVVRPSAGIGVDPSEPQKTIRYSGKRVMVKL